jgi:hypothetical protein
MARSKMGPAVQNELNRRGPANGFGDRFADVEQAGYLKAREWRSPAPAASSTTNILASTVQPTAGTTTLTSGWTQPDVARVLRVVGNQVTVTGTLVVNGLDEDGNVIQDSLVLNGTTAVNGVYAFKSITSIVIPTRGAASDAITIGGGPAIGIGSILVGNSVLLAQMDGVYETTRPTVAFDAAIMAKNVITPNTAFDGAKVPRIYWIDGRATV